MNILPTIHSARHSFGGVICAGAVLLIATSVPAQNLFVSAANNIYEVTPTGTQSTFASGVGATGLAFDSAGNLFVSDFNGGSIYEYAPNGVPNTFASGLSGPERLAFNSAGNLFEADELSGNIYEFTPGGTQSTFASGLSYPSELAFNNAGNLFVADGGSYNVYEFTPDGTRSTFASFPGSPIGLAFQGVTLPVPEPSVPALLAIGAAALLARRRHRG